MYGARYNESLRGGSLFYLDLHTHSTDASDDAGGTVEGYLKWIVGRRKRGFQVDGFVLTEHRSFDPAVDYSSLAAQYDVTVLRGAELETDIGHVLVFGVSERLRSEFDFWRVDLKSVDLFHAARDFGGFAVAAHAGRPRIGLWDHIEAGINPGHVVVIEALNGGSSAEENSRAAHLAAQHGFYSVGGSDAHYVSSIGRCLTAFQRPVRSIEALVEELQTGDYHPLTIEQTLTQE
jgi:predicted metal-dependent phosphoesterase TrpH